MEKGNRGRLYRADDPQAPWAWMAPRRTRIAIGPYDHIDYCPDLTRAMTGRLKDAPEDLELCVFRVEGSTTSFVETLYYGASIGHPHLDVYWSLCGVLAGMEFAIHLKRAFFGERLGVYLDVEHYAKEEAEDVTRVNLVYCPDDDPAAQQYREGLHRKWFYHE